MKAGKVLNQVYSAKSTTAKFVLKDKAEKKGAKGTIQAKAATPIMLIDKNNKVIVNKELINQHGLVGTTLTIANVDGNNYLVATTSKVSGLKLKDKTKSYAASEFMLELREMEGGKFNNFGLERVEKEVPQVTDVVGVFKLKLNLVEKKA